MKLIEKNWENTVHSDLLKMKSTLQFIKEDIDLVMQNVTYSSYKSTPNLFEKLIGFRDILFNIDQELDSLLKEISIFENKISMLDMLKEAGCYKIFGETHQILRDQLDKLKKNYKRIRAEILNFTDSLKKIPENFS